MAPLADFFTFNSALFLEAAALLFALLDPIGTVPIFLAVTEDIPDQRRHIVKESVLIATVILFVFAAFGWLIFDILGITLNDFRIAGGIVLFLVAYEHLSGRETGSKKMNPDEIAAFPLATPLLAGPGAISTVVILANPPYGPLVTLLVIALNGLIAYAILAESAWVQRIFGPNGTSALTRITALLIAAIAVSFVREGIVNILTSIK